ncbi:metal-dependent hydrolase [Paenibacillus lutrae]|uniref:UPF0173 metal-dependent hydrolase EDM21_19465 n=1 Tax=Paenibacillus lutrae TaxID=2078573 RepID=A0A7X3FL91_9BACL|nr:metal-dependent hydrolase [Paenibacillus lutrae]MVP01677.1 metal-dependent hydrolase [Paenibacillus lutrae]
MQITYHGHSCFLVENDGHRLLIDPYLSENTQAVANPEEIQADAILLTHGHHDHIADAADIARKNDCVIIANYEIAAYFASMGLKTFAMNVGGSAKFEWGIIKYTLAFHTSAIEIEPGKFINGGAPAGILLTMGDKTFYHAGDTALFGDMKLYGEMYNIDVAALPIGDVFTMGPEEAVLAATWLRAKKYIPIHYNTFDVIKQDASEWIQKLKQAYQDGVRLAPGETLDV